MGQQASGWREPAVPPWVAISLSLASRRPPRWAGTAGLRWPLAKTDFSPRMGAFVRSPRARALGRLELTLAARLISASRRLPHTLGFRHNTND